MGHEKKGIRTSASEAPRQNGRTDRDCPSGMFLGPLWPPQVPCQGAAEVRRFKLYRATSSAALYSTTLRFRLANGQAAREGEASPAAGPLEHTSFLGLELAYLVILKLPLRRYPPTTPYKA